MATRRKRFVPKVLARKARNLYAAFIGALLEGSVKATRLVSGRDGERLTLSYDDPNG